MVGAAGAAIQGFQQAVSRSLANVAEWLGAGEMEISAQTSRSSWFNCSPLKRISTPFTEAINSWLMKRRSLLFMAANKAERSVGSACRESARARAEIDKPSQAVWIVLESWGVAGGPFPLPGRADLWRWPMRA